MGERIDLLDRFKNNEFITSVQIDPPATSSNKTFDGHSKLLDSIQELISVGVNLVDINSSKRISYDSIMFGQALKQLGLEVIPHVTTRANFLNNLTNQILAGYYLGDVKNYLLITGDSKSTHTTILDQKDPFMSDSATAIKHLNQSLKNALGIDLQLAGAINQNALNLEQEGRRIKAKDSAGADFFMSQPVFDKAQVDKTLEFYKQSSDKPLLLGIWPLLEPSTVERIHQNKISGVKIPEYVYKDAAKYFDNNERLESWVFDKTIELIKFIKKSKRAQGIYIVAPFGKPSQIINLLKKI